MKTRFLMIAVALAAFVGVVNERSHVALSSADAAPKYVGSLTSTDAGQTNVLCTGLGGAALKGDPVLLESVTGDPYCYKTCTTSTCAIAVDAGTGVMSCWQAAYQAQAVPVSINSTDGGVLRALPTVEPVDMAGDSCITAFAVDGGNPKLTVFVNQKTPKLP